VETSHFYTSKDIDKLIQETEAMVTNDLEGGDRQRAMKRLRVPPLGDHQSPWTTFKVGLFSGSFIVLFVAVVLSGIVVTSICYKLRRICSCTIQNLVTFSRLPRQRGESEDRI